MRIFLIVLVFNGTVYAGIDSVGPNGIDATGLFLPNGTLLTGSGIDLGQVELDRPGKPGFDNAANSNPFITPAQVFVEDGAATANINVDFHPEEVAGVMISNDPDAPGVAPGSSLHASAFRVGADEILLSTQHVANQGVLAINHSYVAGGGVPNGNSQVTLGIDYLARIHDVLNVTGNRNEPVGFPMNFPFWPGDHFNGITVARSEKVAGVFRKVSDGNDYGFDADGDRTSVDLIAPGDDLMITGLPEDPVTRNGSSYATPHVTATVGLLQEFGTAMLPVDPSHWDLDHRRHEVSKVVLMNSADKLQDTGDGNLLGMTRTVLRQNGTDTWLTSPAATDSSIPLDLEFGAGHLNARRAVKQFSSGEWDHDAGDVPVIGWDFDTTDGDNTFNRYPIGPALRAGSRISITLAWDRIVEFANDVDGDGNFDPGDTFETYPTGNLEEQVNDLDILLVNRGTLDVVPGGLSIGDVSFGGYNLEHLFFEVPATGQYDIIVDHFGTGIAFPLGPQNYGLAWWGVTDALKSSGDFNGDGSVDSEDLAQWFGDYGVNSFSDADGDGDTDGFDFLQWQLNVGTTAPLTAAVAAVPEPATWLLLATGIVFIPNRKCRLHSFL